MHKKFAGNEKHFAMKYELSVMPLRGRHYWILSVASLGQLIGTMVTTIVGVIIPMINIMLHPELSGFMQGLIGAADLIGICIGSVIFGRLSDRYGYLLFFRLCPAIVLVAAVVSVLAANILVLIICLFIAGLGIGGEYSLDSDYVSELMPTRYRALMVGITKTASAFGNIIAAGVSFGLLSLWGKAGDWPKLMWVVAVTAGVMVAARIYFFQSPGWLLSKGKIPAAEKAVQDFLGKDVTLDAPATKTKEKPEAAQSAGHTGRKNFLMTNWRKVMLSGVPWACEGLGVYGIGVFLPILVMALGLEHFTPGMAPVAHVAESVKITLYISCIILPGFIAGLILINKGNKATAIQTWGFLFCTAALGLLIPAYLLHWNKWIAIGAFMAFEFFLNLGPHLTTYVLPPQIYAVSERGEGVGTAAAVGKIGAVLGVFCIPLLLKAGGAVLVLGVSAGVMAIGALVTFIFRKA